MKWGDQGYITKGRNDARAVHPGARGGKPSLGIIHSARPRAQPCALPSNLAAVN